MTEYVKVEQEVEIGVYAVYVNDEDVSSFTVSVDRDGDLTVEVNVDIDTLVRMVEEAGYTVTEE